MTNSRPTFFVLGAGKAGSTSLAYYIAQHPEIFMSYPKEPPFFQTEYEKGLDYYWQSYFRGYAGERHAGEAAHQNGRLPFVAQRIHKAVPQAKLFLICRNPVERAFSAYWHNVTRGIERRSFEDAIAQNLERLHKGPLFLDETEAPLYAEAVQRQRREGAVSYASYVDSGHYADVVERYAALFGPDRIKVLFFEDLAEDPQSVVDAVQTHLGLEPVPISDSAPQNTPINPGLAKLFGVVTALPGLDRVPDSWRAKVRTLLSRGFSSQKPTLKPATRRQLADHFRPYNQRLAELTDRDLEHWH